MRWALIYGYFGKGNIGDEAILSVTLRELENNYDKLVVLSSDPKRTRLMHGVDSCPEKLTSLEFWKNFLKSSEVFFAGGGRYGGATIKRICILAILAKLFGKRVVFKDQGIYPYEWRGDPVIMSSPTPFRSSITKMLIMIAFRMADEVSVRDKFSKEVLNLSGVKKEIEVKKDPAFSLKPSNPKDSLLTLIRHDVDVDEGPLIGVNLRTLSPEISKKMVKDMSKFFDWAIESYDAQIVFVPFGYGSTPNRFFDDDLIIAKELKRRMKNDERLRIIDKEYPPQKVLGFYRFFDLFVGVRYHSIIFSMIMGVPFIAVTYDTKISELLEDKYCKKRSLRINSLSTSRLREISNVLLGEQ